MKIGLDAKRAFTNKSGLGNYSREIINYINKNYPEIDLQLFTTDKNNDIYNPKNIKIHTPKIKLFKNYWRQYQISKTLKKEKINIYHGLSNEIPKKINNNIKTIVTIHDLIHIKYPEFYNLIDRKIYYHKSKYACENADLIIAISKQTKNDIIKYFNVDERKIKIIYQGCDNSFLNIKKEKNVLNKYGINKPYIINVGTIEKRKNLLLIAKAIKDLKNVNMVCIGKKTNYYNEVIKYLKKEKIENRFLFPKVNNMQDLASIYKESKGLVYSSTYEGFGKPIVEAMYSEIPVILPETDVFKEVGGPHSYYFEKNNKDQLNKLIQKIWNPDDELKLKIKKSRAYTEKFSTKIQCEEIVKIYKELI